MNIARKVFYAWLSVTLLVGCNRPAQPVSSELSELSTLKALHVTYTVNRSRIRTHTSFTLWIENRSRQTFTNCRVTLDGRFRSALADMIYYRGFVQGATRYGTSQLNPGQRLEFTFSDDVSGHAPFRDLNGTNWRYGDLPDSVTVTSDQGAAVWSFSAPAR